MTLLTIGVKQGGLESHFERVEGVVRWLVSVRASHGNSRTPNELRIHRPPFGQRIHGSPTHIWRIIRPGDQSFPLQHVVLRNWTCSDALLQRVRGEVLVLCHQTERVQPAASSWVCSATNRRMAVELWARVLPFANMATLEISGVVWPV